MSNNTAATTAGAQTKSESKFHFGYLVLIGIVLINVAQGAWANTISVFYLPLSNAFGVDMSLVTAWSSIQCVIAAATMGLTGRFFQKFDTKITVTAAAIGIACMNLINGLAPNVYIYWTATLFGAFACDIISFLLGPVVLGNWFKKGVSTMFAITIAAQTIGGVVFSPVVSWIIDNYNYHYAYFMLAALSLVIGIPCALFLVVKTPEEKGLKPIGWKPAEAAAGTDSPVQEETLIGMDAAVAKKKAGFYMLALSAGLWTFVGLLSNFLNTYSQSVGFSVMQAGYITSALMLGGTCGYLGAGLISDIVGEKIAVAIHVCGAMLAFVCILLFGRSIMVIAACSFVIGFGYHGKQVIMTALTRKVFGQRDFATIWGSVGSLNLWVAAVAYIGWARLVGMIGYVPCFALGIAVYVVVTLLCYGALRAAKDYSKEFH